jgi:hypothetical protein
MKTSYKILFAIEIEHDFYADLQCKDFSIIPSAETNQLLKNYQVLVKISGNKLTCLIKTKSPANDKPFSGINGSDKFLFYLVLNSHRFNIISNLDEDKFREGHRFYFSNLAENALDTKINLTASVKLVGGSANYKPGDLTADGTGVVYECIKNTTDAKPPPDPGFWYNRGKQQYVSSRDMLPVRGRVENYTVTTAAKEFKIKVFGLNTSTNSYDKEIKIKNNRVTTDENTKDVQFNLQELSPGKYKVQINSETPFYMFVDDNAIQNNVFGVIEIFSHFPNGSLFGFFDADGKLKDKMTDAGPEWLTYKIHFANRLAFWKYLTPRHNISSIDGGANFNFVASPADPATQKNFFTSNKPIPMNESPWEFKVNVLELSNAKDPLAPNPDPSITGILSRTDAKEYYCTIKLNY